MRIWEVTEGIASRLCSLHGDEKDCWASVKMVLIGEDQDGKRCEIERFKYSAYQVVVQPLTLFAPKVPSAGAEGPRR